MTELELLSIRLARMESRFRWIKGVAIIGLILIATGVIMAQTSPAPRTPSGLDQLDQLKQLPRSIPLTQQQSQKTLVESEVRAEHFILVDTKGKERASLVADAAGSVFLVMFDAAGKTRANLSVTNEGPSLILYDPSAQARTVIGSTTLVPSHVNDNGIAEKAPPSSIVLFDRGGKLLFRQP